MGELYFAEIVVKRVPTSSTLHFVSVRSCLYDVPERTRLFGFIKPVRSPLDPSVGHSILCKNASGRL